MRDDELMEYMENVGYDKRQKKYLKLLTNVFQIKNSRGELMLYSPEPYQVDYHANCILAVKSNEITHRIWKKSRGVGATATTMMDALMVAHRYRKQRIPIASITGDTSDVPIEWAIEYCDTTAVEGFFQRRQDVSTKCVLDNGSNIFSVPGHNPDSIRGYRSVFIVYDEFALHTYPEKLRDAGDFCASEGGQINIISTVRGTENEFWRICENAKDFGYMMFEVPMFDPLKFNIKLPIPLQIESGAITPIAPWADINFMEAKRRSDPVAFMQEYMCDPQDAAVSFLSSSLLYQVSRPAWMLEQQMRHGLGIYVCGIDFASESDMSAFEIFELTAEGWIQRKRVAVQKHDTPEQNRILRELHKAFNFKYVTIDMTGPGTGFYHYAREQLRTEVIGINFSSRYTIDPDTKHMYRQADQKHRKDGKITIPIKRAMAAFMKKEMEDGRCIVFDDADYVADLHSVPYDSLDAARVKGRHGDEFWGSALALWGWKIHENRVYNRPITRRY
jgi:phage FluMu gp28-like protein